MCLLFSIKIEEQIIDRDRDKRGKRERARAKLNYKYTQIILIKSNSFIFIFRWVNQSTERKYKENDNIHKSKAQEIRWSDEHWP